MPHVSKQKIPEKLTEQLEEKITSLLSDTSTKNRKKIFKEILTSTERLMIAKRLAIIHLVQKGSPTHEISKLLKVSPSTVARFENRIEKKSFAITTLWLKNHVRMNKIMRLFIKLASIPFEADKQSFGKMLDRQ